MLPKKQNYFKYIFNEKLLIRTKHSITFCVFIRNSLSYSDNLLKRLCADCLAEIPQQCVCKQQALFLRIEQKYLSNHVIKIKQADSELECGIYCVADGSCASVNYKISGIGKGRCELNNRTLQEASDKETYNPEFTHLAVVKRVSIIL